MLTCSGTTHVMSPELAHGHNPHSTGHVIRTVRTLMRSRGLDVTLAAIARECGVTRNFLYANWKSVSALQVRALGVELSHAFDASARDRPSDGTVPGITAHLTEVVRRVRRHPTTAAVVRTSPEGVRAAHSAVDGPLVRIATERVSDLLHPLCPHGGVWGDRTLASRPWKIMWLARPAALCPEAVGDPDLEQALDAAFGELTLDVLAPWHPGR